MTVKLGTNPIAWSNDDMLELGGDTPLETCLHEARIAGFEGIELGNKFPRTADVLSPILDTHNIGLIGGWYSTNLLVQSADMEIEALQGHLELLKAMGCGVFIMAETSNAIHGDKTRPLSESPVIAPGDWKRFADRISKVSAYIQDQGLATAYHHHMGTVVETADEIDAFMNHIDDQVGLLLDTGHAYFAGADPALLASTYGPRITHVHCKDVRADVHQAAIASNSSFLNAVVDGVFTVPGDGNVDFPPVLDALKAVGYQSWLVVEAEQDPAKANPMAYARLGYENLLRMSRQAEL